MINIYIIHYDEAADSDDDDDDDDDDGDNDNGDGGDDDGDDQDIHKHPVGLKTAPTFSMFLKKMLFSP